VALGEEKVMAAAGVTPGATLTLQRIPEPEMEPDEVQHDAAISIQSLARGWRARRAVDLVFATRTGSVNKALFRLVMQDQHTLLREVLLHVCESRLTQARNPAGHSLLELATERGRLRVKALLRGLLGVAPSSSSDEEAVEEEIEGLPPPVALQVAGSPRVAAVPEELLLPTGARARVGADSAGVDGSHLELSSMVLPEDDTAVLRGRVALSSSVTRAAAVRAELARLHGQLSGDHGEPPHGVSMPGHSLPAAAWSSSSDAGGADMADSRGRSGSRRVSRGWRTGVSTHRAGLREGFEAPPSRPKQQRQLGPLLDPKARPEGALRSRRTSKGGQVSQGRGVRSMHGRGSRAAPVKRKHIGCLASLVSEPLYLARATQPGTEVYLDTSRGNLAMHAAMRAITRATMLPAPSHHNSNGHGHAITSADISHDVSDGHTHTSQW
jgi:hypothetical protein